MRIGILGSGWVADHRHLPVWTSRRDVHVVSIFDRNLGRARRSAQTAGVPVATDNLEEFFAQAPEAVSVCSSPWSHCELTVAALERGCHVLTEKPMAMNSDEARQMASAAEAAQRVLCVAHNFLFSSAVRRADAALRDTGPPLYVMGMQLSSERRRLPAWYQELPAGLLFDEIPHLLYMLQHYLGRLHLETVRVTRRTRNGHPATTEILVAGDHGPGQVVILSESPISEWHLSVVAPDRVIDLDLFRDITVEVPSDGAHRAGDILKTSGRAVASHVWGFAKSGTRLTTGRLYWGHDVLIERFLEATRGDAKPPVSVDDALGVVALTDQILSALEDG